MLVQSIKVSKSELLVQLLEVINAVSYMDKYIFTTLENGNDIESSILFRMESAGLENALEELI